MPHAPNAAAAASLASTDQADTSLSRIMDASLPTQPRVIMDDSDSETELKGPRTMRERRQAQNARFKAFILETAQQDVIKERDEVEKEIADEETSIRTLLEKQESTPIIANPRDYQVELFEKAKAQNTIAVLDTGSGKTLVAVLLLRHAIDQELEDRKFGWAPRISFFLVPSVNLVFQQWAVLKYNLDHAVEPLCGSMGCELWNKAEWDKHFAANQVIVCTADVLLQCLMHSFINIKQMNFLIFDEAHHAKKNNAYAKIIQDYYMAEPDEERRPKIFGMTASPVDAKVDDIAQAVSDLEYLLHSRIATISDSDLLQKSISRPHEEILRYSSIRRRVDSGLTCELRNRCEGLAILRPMLARAKEINDQLGPWAADHYWDVALAEKQAKKREARMERSRSGGSVESVEQEIIQLNEASRAVREYNYSPLQLDTACLSPKVLKLYEYLRAYFERPSNHRCLVFVKQRNTARLLHALMTETKSPHLHSSVLVGFGNSDRLDEANSSFRDQLVTLMRFRKGQLNCLFATSVAEEGLDIPDCNLIVRFDPARTVIQYIQSRGRARHKNSRMLHMLELGNPTHETTLNEVRFTELAMKKFYGTLPADRRLLSDHDAGSGLHLKDENKELVIESTGAKLTYGQSMVLLAHFVSSLPTETANLMQPNYVMGSRGDKFICEVILPEESPIKAVMGKACNRKMEAKQSAAFEACKQLSDGQYLDQNLLPVYKKMLPAMRNAALALNMKSTGQYIMRSKPSLWKAGRGSLPTELYLLIIDVPDGLERSHRPLVLLSRTRLPNFPEFPLFLTSGEKKMVKSLSLAVPLEVSETGLDKFTTFTLRVFKDIFNKTYERDPSNMSYWLAPAAIRTIGEAYGVNMSCDAINWPLLDEIEAHVEYRWSPEMSDEFLLGKYLIDPWNGGNRFFTTRMAPEYKPTDPIPENTARGSAQAKNILQYSVNLWKRSAARVKWTEDQPVVETEKINHRRNMLAEPERKESVLRSLAFVCPEPLRISALPPAVVTVCYVFPAIIHRLESYLIAAELCETLEIRVDLALALEACTKDSDNSEEHETQERINFQRGMGNNYERLEFLGDCFLKMATSISTFNQNPNDNEFEFHVKRQVYTMLLLCNKNLFKVAMDLKTYEYVRSQAFSRRTWYPEGIKLLEGKGANKVGNEVFKHALQDKTVADISEALIGAAFLTHNTPGDWLPEKFDEAVKTVTTVVGNPDHIMLRWSDYVKTYEKPTYQTDEASASQLDLARKVEKEHSYHFRYPRLVQSAFTHPSYPSSWEPNVPSYQRLEFLGDSLLDLACITYLFYRYPTKDPRWLTEHKMAMVSNKFLGAVCVKLGFHRHLRHNSSTIENQIMEYATDLLEAEAKSGGARNFWTDVKDPPKCLPDIVESYVGAMFIDSDFNYGEVQRFFNSHIKWYFEDMRIYDTFANNHPITRLHNTLDRNFGCQDYRLMTDEIPTGDARPPIVVSGLMAHETVVAYARGKSHRYVKMRAAVKAQEELDGLPTYEFRKRYGCDCHLKEEEQEQQDGNDGVTDHTPLKDVSGKWRESKRMQNSEHTSQKHEVADLISF